MSANTHWNAPPPTYEAHSQSSSTLTPYLQLPHLLSLAWLAYPILSLLFVAFRLQLSLASAEDAIASAKSNLFASCKAAERAATSAASMPRYLAIASNEQFADVVNGSLNAARATLVLALTVMEAIINFIVDIYRSTLLCFLELVVRGGLSILISAVNELNNVVKDVANGLRNSIQNDIQSANSVITKAIDAINKVNPFGDITPPQIPVPNLDSLNNISLPSTFQDALTNLNNSLPTVAQLKNEIESIIDQPFELLKKDINDTFSTISFNSSVLPVPQQNLLTFCNDMDLSVVDDAGHDLVKAAKIGTIILILLALLLVGLNCLLEWYKWRCMKAHLEYTRQAWTSDPTIVHVKVTATPSMSLTDHNLMILNADSSHPLLTRIANNMSKALRLTPTQHTHLRWFFHYIFHPPAAACFLIGLIGLLSIQIQLLALGPVVAKYKERSAATTADFSNTIFTAINASMYNQSASYANDVNTRVDAVQSTINDGVFGWVNTTTTTLNNTIVTFYDDVQNAVGTVFNGTILETPAREFIRCFIGSKVDAIENALTFLHDNLHIDIPRVNQTVLVMSPDSVNETTRPIAAAALGGDNGNGGTDEGLILRLVNSYAESLKKERLNFAIFLGLWGVVVLMALCIIFWNAYGKRLVEKRKRKRWEREQRAGIDGLVVPFRMHTPTPPGEKRTAGTYDDLPSFTPLPSPKGSAFKPFSFSRNASPAASKTDLADPSPSSGDEAEQRDWGAAFKQRFIAPPKPNKLMAIGRKAMGKERLVADQQEEEEHSSSSGNAASNKRTTAWFGRVASMLDRKHASGYEPEPQQQSPQKLHISIDRPSTDNGTAGNTGHAPSSRWSSSPIEPSTEVSPPWKSIMKKTPPPPPQQLLPVRSKPQPRDTPSDVDFEDDDATLMAPLQPTPAPTVFAPPIHHGFDDSRYPRLRPPPPVPPLSRTQTQQTLAPPPAPGRHRRTSSVPVPPSPNGDGAITPVTRLLTSMHARKSSASLDPFVTPFDDEYKVTVNPPPPHTRKSIPTNPFLGPTAVALINASTNSTTTSNLDQGGMVRIFAGYTMEQDELVRFLAAQGWGPEPGELQFTIDEAWMTFLSWRGAQPRRGDLKTLFPWPQYWYNKDGEHVHAFMTRRSDDVSNPRLRFKEAPLDLEIRDRFIEQTGNVLDPSKMKFWSLPENVLHFSLHDHDSHPFDMSSSDSYVAQSRPILWKPAQPAVTPVELLRQMINRKHGLHLDYNSWLDLWEALNIVASTPPNPKQITALGKFPEIPLPSSLLPSSLRPSLLPLLQFRTLNPKSNQCHQSFIVDCRDCNVSLLDHSSVVEKVRLMSTYRAGPTTGNWTCCGPILQNKGGTCRQLAPGEFCTF
ncbi:hypothetical protein LshimejAT787_0400670 [Lyophyllum shimeji]|uniref:Plasma membrane fusion protein PRM1 n=1 Tax=Lyophyllum shimeji TaxID=47721 RepID=A0A9P3UN63_LYOSH|nr:hypothetical protein LshimejAT787_0400670 [Lyophyllum shimeji]